MADFGMKVSQPGLDVESAADYQLNFSSSWPLLKIHKRQPFTIPDLLSGSTVFTHKLGYPPLFMIFKVSGGKSQLVSPGDDVYGDSFQINGTELRYIPGGGAVAGSYTGFFYIYRFDITKNFTAPILQIGATPPMHGPNFGLKVALDGEKADSDDLRNYAIHSSASSPMIHQCVNGPLNLTGGNYDLVATHNLTYAPLYFTFIKVSGSDYYTSFYGGNGNNVLLVNSFSITQRSNLAGNTGSIVVFKEPFLT